MNIALLNTKVHIEKQTVHADEIGNHISDWEDYHICHATISGESGQETIAAGQTVDHTDCNITVRWCQKLSAVNTTEYRIVMDGEIYNIIGIDHMANKRKALKFKCKKVARS